MKLQNQNQARDLYLNHGKSQTDIAQMLGIDRKTVYNWIKEGRWEEMKMARYQAPASIAQQVYGYIAALNKRIASRNISRDVPYKDEVLMLSRMLEIAKEQERINIGVYIQAFDELVKYISAENEELAVTITAYTDAFIKTLIPADAFPAHEQEPEEEKAPVKTKAPAPKNSNGPTLKDLEEATTGQERNDIIDHMLKNAGIDS